MKPIPAGLERLDETSMMFILGLGRRRHPSGRKSRPTGNPVPIPPPSSAGPLRRK